MSKPKEEHVSSKRTCLCKPLPIPRTCPVSKELCEKCSELILNKDQLKQYMDNLLSDIKKGLAKATQECSSVKCFVTYVQETPDGSEEGKFLALDLGGTNFRVLLVELTKNHFSMKSKVFATPQSLMVGTGVQLFDHIATCLAEFMKAENLMDKVYSLGFTFSFPVRQVGLTKGILESWSKGFNCSGVVGNDVVQLLKEAIDRRGDIKIDVCAVLNDTTGTLMSCAWKNHFCKIGLIIGTGTNACYVEKQANAEFFDEPDNGSGNVLINTEWGGFGNDGSLDYLRTSYDFEVDKHTINKGFHIHEKMISGMYMGELVRLAIERFTKEGILFGGKCSEDISTKDKFLTKYVSDIESDPPGSFVKCKEVLAELGIKCASEKDCINVRFICECFSRRAAHLVSAGLATIVNKIDEPRITIGIDGSLYRFHPHFHNLMMEKMMELVKPCIVFDLMLSEDGSGRGAALVAAVAASRKK